MPNNSTYKFIIINLLISILIFISLVSILFSVSTIPIATDNPKLFHSIQNNANIIFILWMIMGPLLGIITGIIAIYKLPYSKKIDYFIYFSIISGLSIPLCFKISNLIIMHNCKYAIENAQPIISALDAYYRNTGMIPKELNEIVPLYLLHIPDVGLLGYRNFIYSSHEKIMSQYRDLTQWELLLIINRGILCSGEALVYWPQNNYPMKMYGGHRIKIKAWAYYR